MKAPVVVPEQEALRIINELDVNAFNDIVPIPMREDRALRRLTIYQSKLRDDVTKSPSDPTRKSASFLLGRDQFHGASNAGSIIKLALLHNRVDNDLVNSFTWDYANVDHYIGQRIGMWNPLSATPVMNQGHWQESVVRARLESERGYRFDNDMLAKLNATTLPNHPDIRATNDGAGYRGDGVSVITELKAVADKYHDFSEAAHIHIMQSQVQSLVAAESGLKIQQAEIHYPEFSTGLIHSYVVPVVPELQELYVQGTIIANEYIEAGYIPNLDKVQVSTLPFSPEEKVKVSSYIDMIEASSLLEKSAKERKADANKMLDSIFKSHGMGKDQVSAENLMQGTSRLKGTMKAYYQDRIQPDKVVELARQHGVYDNALENSDDMSDTHKAAVQQLTELGVDATAYTDKTLDIDKAIELLEGRGVERSTFFKPSLVIASMDVKSKAENRAEARSYAESLRSTTQRVADQATKQVMAEKPKVLVFADEATQDSEAKQEKAPTLEAAKKMPGNAPGNM